MAMLDLDKVINITSWGGGGGLYPGWDNPAPYPIVSQHIGLFSKPNAWDTDSNGWFGLLDSSNNLINAQNAQFNTQIAPAPVSGTGPLSTRVKSFNFSANISSVNSGKIKYGIFKSSTGNQKTIMFDKTEPGYVKTINTQDKVIVWGFWVVTVDGVKYWFQWDKYFQMDNNYKVIDDGTAIPWFPVWPRQLAGTSWNKLWYFYTESLGSGVYKINGLSISVASGMVFTIWTPVNQYWNNHARASYQLWDEIFIGIHGSSSTDNIGCMARNIVTETFSSKGNSSDFVGNAWRAFGVDGTWAWFVWAANNIYTQWSWTSASSFGVSPWYRLYNGWLSVASDTSNNVIFSSGAFGTDVSNIAPFAWTTTYTQQSFITRNTIFENTLVPSNQDDAIVWIVLWQDDIYENTTNPELDITINGTSVWTTNILSKGTAILTKNVWAISIGQPYIEIELSSNKTDLGTYKIALWATGWDFTTPALPANNGLSGTSTTKRESTVNSTDLYLTLA